MLFYDGLTDLPNRALFADRLQRALIHAQLHSDYKCAVLFVEIDESRGRGSGSAVADTELQRFACNFQCFAACCILRKRATTSRLVMKTPKLKPPGIDADGLSKEFRPSGSRGKRIA